MVKKDVSIRDLKTEDIPEAMNLVLEEGWNQTEKDWKLFLNHRGNICKCAEIDGQLVATTTSYNFSNEVAWISMVIVNKKYRGFGISKMLLNSVLNELKNCKSIKLDATDAGRKVYQKLGFVDEYRISRMVNDLSDNTNYSDVESAVRIGNKDVADIIEMDNRVFGAQREQLINAWFLNCPHGSWLIRRNDQIKGFVLGRNGNRFFQLGPVSAKNLSEAKNLVSQALKTRKGKPVVLDVMNDKTEFILWLNSLGFEKKREFTRMYYKSNSSPGENTKQFIIGGPEFG